MKKVQFEYGQGVMEAELPDSMEIFVPGETVPDPPFLEDPQGATRESILNPIGMPPISKLVKKGSTVTISFPDKVKGGLRYPDDAYGNRGWGAPEPEDRRERHGRQDHLLQFERIET